MPKSPIDLAETIPTLLPEQLRTASQQAYGLAADRFNALDENPFISREWLIVAEELRSFADSLEKRLYSLFNGRELSPSGPREATDPADRERPGYGRKPT